MTTKIIEKKSDLCECGKVHRKKQVWDEIPKTQKKHLSVCPCCKKNFWYWQLASKHSHLFKHYGDYSV